MKNIYLLKQLEKMERKTFILLKKRTYRHTVKVFIKGEDGKMDKRPAEFKTEHLVREVDRVKKARKIEAEYSTDNEVMYDALLRDTGYGKTFILKGDEELKYKKEPFNVTPMDNEKIALKNLFQKANLDFDSKKANAVLREELTIYLQATTGNEIGKSSASAIPHKEVNVMQEIEAQANEARKVYVERYGEPIPEKYANDKSFLSTLLMDENWDAKGFIAKKEGEVKSIESAVPANAPEGGGGAESTDDVDALQQEYFSLYTTNAPNAYKNNIAWLKDKIAAKKQS